MGNIRTFPSISHRESTLGYLHPYFATQIKVLILFSWKYFPNIVFNAFWDLHGVLRMLNKKITRCMKLKTLLMNRLTYYSR